MGHYLQMSDGHLSDDEITAKIIDILVEDGMIDRDKITMDATLESLEVESMDMVMVLQGIEDAFEIYVPLDESVTELRNVGDVVDHITKLVHENARTAG